MLHNLYVIFLMLKAALKSRMEYRLDFLLFVIMGTIFNLVQWLFIWIVLDRFKVIAGWRLEEMFFLYSIRLVAQGLFLSIFRNVMYVPYFVAAGDLDRFLLRPNNPLIHILAHRYDPAWLGDLGLGIVCFMYSAQLVSINWSPLTVVFLILAIIGGALVEAAIYLCANTFTFWIVDAQYFTNVLSSFNQFALYPLTIFNTFLQVVLTFIIPFAFMSYYPASAFLNRAGEVPFHPAFAYLTPVIGIAVFTLAYSFWRVGLSKYQGTGS